MKKEDTSKNKIDYWSKHQELDKFNISQDTAVYLGYLAITISLFVLSSEAIKIAFPDDPETLKFILAVLLFGLAFTILYLSQKWRRKINGHNSHFIAREEMIRYWYNNLKENKVDTDKLDRKCKKIREILPIYSGERLREKVKEIMEKD